MIGMPSTSARQRRTMAAAAHDPAFAKRMGIPQSVAKEFNAADQAKKQAGRDKIARVMVRQR
jgi:hypothetical protein